MYANHLINIKVQNMIDTMLEKQQYSPLSDDLAESVTTEVFKEQYLDTFKIKDKLEEKAKTNVVGVTIAITLIMGASGVVNTIYGKFSTQLVNWIAFGLLSVAVMYMIAAGLLAIKVLISDNKMFFVNLQTFADGDRPLKLKYNDCTYLNTHQNIIRNNSIFTSYECIRNALVCLFLILMLVIIPIKPATNAEKQSQILLNDSNGQYEFFYSAGAVDFMKSNDIQGVVQDTIISNLNSNKDKPHPDTEIGIADLSDGIFIQYSFADNTVNVLLIEPISNSINP
jgi:hypothetical protein